MKTLILITLGAALTFLSSCNTISGVGRDLQQGGAAVTNAAHNATN